MHQSNNNKQRESIKPFPFIQFRRKLKIMSEKEIILVLMLASAAICGPTSCQNQKQSAEVMEGL